VSNQDQLAWEARLRRPVAVAAFASGLLLLVGTIIFQSILEDRPRTRSLPDFLLSVNESPGTLIASEVVQMVAALCLIPVFYYLFRATLHRGGGMPSWFVYFVILGPALYAVSRILGVIDRIDVAELFADGAPILGRAGEDRAEDLLREDPNAVAIAISLLGSVLTAFLFVMVPLRARRVGLLSAFLGILGPIVGALLVLQLIPLVPVVLQAFWLGAVGALVLGNWPGGRGPAWESGEAEPWPSAAQKRLEAQGGAAPAPDAPPPEPEPVPDRPSSRKRRRKS
jgi:hypothetical protein